MPTARFSTLSLLIPVAASLLLPVATNAATIQVASGAVVVASDAVCSLREAIDNANTDADTHADCAASGIYGDDVIELANATYTIDDGPYAADGDNGLPSITDTVTIEANGAIVERNAAANDDFRIFRVSGTGVTFTLNDATVRNGRAAGGVGLANRGGAMLDRSASVLNNCNFVDNYAEDDGGAIAYAQAGSSSIHDSTIEDNRSDGSGAAIFNGEPHILLISGTVVRNNHTAGSGGGIMNFATVNTTCTLITENSGQSGGGVYNATTGRMRLERSTVSDNEASGTTAFTGSGGGIHHSGGNSGSTGTDGLYVADSTISGNRAAQHGGGIYNSWGNVFVYSSTIAGNIADFDGVDGGTGGGLANFGSSFVAGMTVFTSPARLDLGHTIVADNSDGGNGANDCVDLQQAPLSPQLDSYGYNLIEDIGGCALTQAANPGTDITGVDPVLPNLAFEPSACTPTQCPTTGPAIDGGAASATSCPGGGGTDLTVDQAGRPRPVGGFCDIGACELQVAGPIVRPAPVLPRTGLVALVALLATLGAAYLRTFGARTRVSD